MTPEEFMVTLTDMVFVEHFDAGTWRTHTDPVTIGNAVQDALNAIVSYELHPSNLTKG